MIRILGQDLDRAERLRDDESEIAPFVEEALRSLARLQLQVGLKALLDRTTRFALEDDPTELVPLASYLLNGWVELDLRLEPRLAA